MFEDDGGGKAEGQIASFGKEQFDHVMQLARVNARISEEFIVVRANPWRALVLLDAVREHLSRLMPLMVKKDVKAFMLDYTRLRKELYAELSVLTERRNRNFSSQVVLSDEMVDKLREYDDRLLVVQQEKKLYIQASHPYDFSQARVESGGSR